MIGEKDDGDGTKERDDDAGREQMTMGKDGAGGDAERGIDEDARRKTGRMEGGR